MGAVGTVAQTGCISNYRHGRSIPDTYTMARLAKMIESDPMTAIAAAEAKRAKTEKARKFWEGLISSAGIVSIMPAIYEAAKVGICILCKIWYRLRHISAAPHAHAAQA
jgi:hypothetical protein